MLYLYFGCSGQWTVSFIEILTVKQYGSDSDVSVDRGVWCEGGMTGQEKQQSITDKVKQWWVIHSEDDVGGRARVTRDEERVLQGGGTETRDVSLWPWPWPWPRPCYQGLGLNFKARPNPMLLVYH